MPDDEACCSRCGRTFSEADFVACIAARIMGDACTDCYYWCAACGVYTVRLYRDVFVGEETAHGSEPISREEGERRLGLIRSCENPGDDRCHCKAHLEYFGGWVD